MSDSEEERRASRRLRQAVAPGVDEMATDEGVAVAARLTASAPAMTVLPEAAGELTERAAVAGPSDAGLPGPGPFDPGRRGVRALAAVAAVVVFAAAVLAWRARPTPEPVAGPDVAVPAPATPEARPPDSEEPGTSRPAEVVVSVAGMVRRPGLVRLPPGSRVADAVEAAGGVLPGTDIALLNLARRVGDGELILIGITAPPGLVDPGGVGSGASGPGAPAAGPVDLNTATLAQLDALPGVGPVLAGRIIDHRERHGAFRAVDELREVDGIGEARYEELKTLVTV